MQLMHALDAGNTLQILLDIIELDTWRRRLQKNSARALGQRYGRGEYHKGDPERDSRIGVEAGGRLGEPDYQRGDYNTYVVEGVAHDVDEDAQHAEIHALRRDVDGEVVVSCVAGRGCVGCARLCVRVFRMAMLMLVTMAMPMPMIVSPGAMIMLMQEQRTDDIQRQPHTSHNQYQFRVLDVLEIDKAFDGLQEDAQTKGKQERAVEEGTEEVGASPAKGQICRRGFALGHVDGDESDYEADEVVEVVEGIGDEGEGFGIEADCCRVSF
jgi:hypothetical protein